MSSSDDHACGAAAALARALAEHPTAGVSAITGAGQFCPIPASVPVTGHPVLEGRSVFDVVSTSSIAAVVEGWKRTQQHGIGVAEVHTPDGREATILCFDSRPEHGVFVMLLIPGSDVPLPPVDLAAPLASRFGTYRRDPVATIIDVDDGARGLLGWDLADIGDRTAIDLIHPDDRENANANWLDVLSRPGRPQRYRCRHQRRDGSYLWVEITNTNRLDDPAHRDVLSEMVDVSQEAAATEALRQSEELLRRLTEALPLGVVQIDRQRRVVYANPRLYEIVGRYASNRWDDQLQAVLVEDRPRLADAVDAVLAGGGGSVEVRLRLAGAAEERVCSIALQALRDPDGTVSGAVACITDITESTAMRRELEHRATFDLLTRCHNRASTMLVLERLVARSSPGTGTGVVFVDLDRFRSVNDELGHAAGDALLITVADRLRAAVRHDDLVGRLGGDEFLVVCPSVTGEEDLADVAERIPDALARPVVLAGRTLHVTASVGAACSTDGYLTPDALVAAADADRCRAKRAPSGDSPGSPASVSAGAGSASC